MRNNWITAGILLLICACGHRKKETLIQEKNVNGFTLQLQYMPSEEKDKDLLYFKLNIRDSNGAALKNMDDNRFSYGLDSLFAIINVTDTLHPVDVIRVANGNVNGIEYMLLFDRPNAYSQADCHLLFRDWLFTHQLMTFPIQGSAIAHIDSLSQKI